MFVLVLCLSCLLHVLLYVCCYCLFVLCIGFVLVLFVTCIFVCCVPVYSPRGGGGGGGTLTFSSYIGLDPASSVYKKNISEISGITQKIFEILATPKNIPILYIDLKKKNIKNPYEP